MHLPGKIIALMGLAIGVCACGANGAPSDGPLGEADEKLITTDTFCSASCNGYEVIYSSGPTTDSYDELFVYNTLNQYWWAQGAAHFDQYEGVSATTANIDGCENSYITYLSYWWNPGLSEWFCWAGDSGCSKTAYATPTISGGVITSCYAAADTGFLPYGEYFDTATELETKVTATSYGGGTTHKSSTAEANIGEFSCTCP